MTSNEIEILINVVTPLIFVVIGILANRLGRKDGDNTPALNYFAVGTSVLIMSLASILSDIQVDSAGVISGSFGWITFYILFVFVSIDIDRYTSWERCSSGLPTNKKHIFRGVILPNTIGVGAFCLYRFMA